MLKFASIVCLVAICRAQESTTGSSFQNFLAKLKNAGANVDLGQLSAGASKAQEALGPMISQFKEASKPIQNKLAEVGLVPTTTANPIGGVLKHLQMVGIGSDIDVAKVQENANKARDTLGPLFSQFSGLVDKKSANAAVPAPAQSAVVEDRSASATAPAATPAAPPGGPPSKSADFQGALETLRDVGSKIDVDRVKDGAQKLQSFFSQFSKKSGTS